MIAIVSLISLLIAVSECEKWRHPVFQETYVPQGKITTDGTIDGYFKLILAIPDDFSDISDVSSFTIVLQINSNICFSIFQHEKRWCCNQCSSFSDCSAWCIIGSDCYVTSFIMSAGTQLGDQLCFTVRRAGNLIFDAISYGSANSYGRGAYKMQEGVFNYHWKQWTLLVTNAPVIYMAYEFPQLTLVTEITMRIPAGQNKPDNAKIFVGENSWPPEGDMSEFDQIATYSNAQDNEWKTFKIIPPRMIKFIAIQEGSNSQMGLYFLEVF